MKQDCLKNFLIRCCYWYYVKGDPIIRDQEYDMEFKRLQKMEADNGEADDDSPTQKIWGDLESQYPDWAKQERSQETKDLLREIDERNENE